MVQGINQALNNQAPIAPMTAAPPSAPQATEPQQAQNAQNMQMMPSMPMPAQVNMPAIEQLPPPVDQNAQAAAQNLNNGMDAQGAQPSGVLNPPEVSTNPLNDRYGFIKDDLYGTKNTTGVNGTDLIPSQGLNLFPESSAYYNPDKPQKQSPLAALGIGKSQDGTKKSNPIASIFKTALLAVGGIVLFKSIKGAKSSKKASELFSGVKNFISSKTVREFDEFRDFFTDTMGDLANLQTKHVSNIKLNFKNHAIDELKDVMGKTRELATEYSRLPGVRPNYVVYMKEGMEPAQDAIVDALKRNDFTNITDNMINGIEEINLIAEKIAKNTEIQNNIVFTPAVRNNYNTHNNSDLFHLAGQNLRNRIINLFSK